jgi:hypothetical protein
MISNPNQGKLGLLFVITGIILTNLYISKEIKITDLKNMVFMPKLKAPNTNGQQKSEFLNICGTPFTRFSS